MQKIMFNNEYGLTYAVRQGRKTMTRRIAYDGEIKDIHTGYITEGVDAGRLALCDGNMIVAKSKYKLGEVLAVAQSYKDLGYTKEWVEQHISPNPNAKPTDPFEKKYPGWNNKMFVPAELNEAQRIRITDIKAERLQDISEEDCLKEGIQECFPYIDRDPNDKVRTFQYFKDGKIRYRISPASECFAHLIDDVSGKGTWASNPWNFAYTFELIK